MLTNHKTDKEIERFIRAEYRFWTRKYWANNAKEGFADGRLTAIEMMAAFFGIDIYGHIKSKTVREMMEKELEIRQVLEAKQRKGIKIDGRVIGSNLTKRKGVKRT